MPIEPGQTLLHYRIVEKIGEGGMGAVWKAVDTALDREVAIKILPAAFSEDPDRLARFEREAKLLASLNHENITTIHGLHEVEGLRFIAMELAQGEDLAQRLQRGPLPLDEVLIVGREVAEALEAAHEQGVIHRDLKPANVVLGAADRVEVLDFGLAKALEREPTSGGTDPAMSPTLTSGGQTRDGMILGTAAYMSPEQARGRPVDRRADIWAFGCLLYEALTGERAFPGETVSDTLVAVLSREPDWSALPAGTPPRLRRLLERCLTRDERRRLRDIGEARIVIEDVIAGDGGAAAEVAVPEARRPSPARWAILGVAGAVLFAAGWLLRPSESVEARGLDPDSAFRRLTFGEGLEFEPALSPDGNYVAYTTDEAGNLDIAILPLAGGNVNRVVTHPADDAHPRWSPDGTRLAFVSARGRPGGYLTTVGGLGSVSTYIAAVNADLYLVPALGGAASKLADRAAYPTWSPDGSALAFQSDRDGQWHIWRMPAAGGEPVKLTDGDGMDFQPAWSPDGRFIAYGSFEDGLGLYVVPAAGGERTRLFEGMALEPAWSPDGRWIYFSTDRTAGPAVLNLWRLPVGGDGRPVAAAEHITFGEGSDIDVSLSSDGRRLAFSTVRFAPDVWALDVQTRVLRRITSTDGSEDAPHLHPDGRTLLFESDRTGSSRLWTLDLVDGTLQQLTTPGETRFARWSPDGSRIAYELDLPDGPRRLAVQRRGDATPEIVVKQEGAGATAAQWSPDGRLIAASAATSSWIHELGGASTELPEPGVFPTWSPDGGEIAVQREVRSGVRELWIVPAGAGEARRVAGGDVEYSHPQWCPTDPDRILVVIDHKDLGIVRVSTGEVERVTDLASSTVLVDYPSWSADGTTVYFSLSRKRGDVFLIEGL